MKILSATILLVVLLLSGCGQDRNAQNAPDPEAGEGTAISADEDSGSGEPSVKEDSPSDLAAPEDLDSRPSATTKTETADSRVQKEKAPNEIPLWKLVLGKIGKALLEVAPKNHEFGINIIHKTKLAEGEKDFVIDPHLRKDTAELVLSPLWGQDESRSILRYESVSPNILFAAEISSAGGVNLLRIRFIVPTDENETAEPQNP